MKEINKFIIEKLRINKDTGKGKYSYKYHPKTKEELRKILEKRLKIDKNTNLNDIDVSNITDMGVDDENIGLFDGLDPHNIDISEWNVSNVTNMKYMFFNCRNFNSDLSNWDVSNVDDMGDMFIDSPLEKNPPKWYKD